MVHLADCENGGETVLLNKLMGGTDSVLASVSPVRGRLLIFVSTQAIPNETLFQGIPLTDCLCCQPHLCPHAGLPVDDVPKLFLRGELILCASPIGSMVVNAESTDTGTANTSSESSSGSSTLDTPLPWEAVPEPELLETGPARLGVVTRPLYEALLWRLVDNGLCPRIVPGSLWCEPLDTQAFFARLPPPVDPGASRTKGPLPKERAHRKRCQIVAIARLVEALLPPISRTASTCRYLPLPAGIPPPVMIGVGGDRPLVVDFCGGGGHLALVLAACHPAVDFLGKHASNLPRPAVRASF